MSSASSLVWRSACDLSASLKDGSLTSTQITAALLERIVTVDPKLNSCVLPMVSAAAPKAAEEADERNKNFTSGDRPLAGLPVAIKDSLEISGFPTTMGVPPLLAYISPEDAAVVARLRSAGAVFVTKTNLPIGCFDGQTDGPLHQRCNNPWNIERTPGGSSGGNGAGLAAGLFPLAIGSDIGGSVRIPASYCGIFSLKPTEGLVSQIGHLPPPPGAPRTNIYLASVGPMARTVSDLRMAMEIISGPDPLGRDPLVVPFKALDCRLAASRSISKLRFAYSMDWNGQVRLDSDTRTAFKAAIEALKATGAEVVEAVPIENCEAMNETWGEVAGCTALVTAPLEQIPPWIQNAKEDPACRGVMAGRLGQISFPVAKSKMDAARAEYGKFFLGYDAFLTPAVPTVAIPHCQSGTPVELGNGQEPLSYMFAFTAFATLANLTGAPCGCVPLANFTKSNLPVGMLVHGRHWGDLDVLRIMEMLEDRITGKFVRPPMFAQ
jgi:amidase